MGEPMHQNLDFQEVMDQNNDFQMFLDGPIDARGASDTDSAYDSNDGGSSRYSLRESIMEYRVENGRTYHRLSDGKYGVPNDEKEQERLELVHNLYTVTFDNQLCLCPKNQGANRVLDLATGTGAWSMDYADAHPEAEVIGVDLSPIQPNMIPPNCSFIIDDMEKEWLWTRRFDFIFARCLMGCVASWEDMLANVYEHLEPGGYFEFQDTTLPIKCDDGTVTPDTPILQWTQLLQQAMETIGQTTTVAPRMASLLAQAGFEGITVTRRRWAHSPWPRDRRMRELAVWSQHASMYDVEALTLRPFTQILGWSREDTEEFCERVRDDLRNREIHAYWEVYSVYARKPMPMAPAPLSDDGIEV